MANKYGLSFDIGLAEGESESMPPAPADGGRGKVNPPLVNTLQNTREKNKEQARSLDTRDQNSILALGAGLGRGVSAGLTNYPAALALQISRNASGLSTTYQDALKMVSDYNQQTNQQNPIAYNAGQFAGGLGLGLATGGGGIAANIAKNAAIGGLSSYNENQSIKEGALGAGIGATLGSLGSAASAAINKGLSGFGVPTASKTLSSNIADTYAKTPSLTPSASEIVIPNPPSIIWNEVKNTWQNIAKNTNNALGGNNGTILGNAVAGGAAGAAAAGATGNDPTTGFIYGAGAGVAKAKSELTGELIRGTWKVLQNAALLTMNPAAAPATVKAVSNISSPAITKNANQPQNNISTSSTPNKYNLSFDIGEPD
jgi:hypothetical protein